MDWFIFCPLRGLYTTYPDDDAGYVKVIQDCRELADEIKTEGYTFKDITVIRGTRNEILPPGDWQLRERKAQ